MAVDLWKDTESTPDAASSAGVDLWKDPDTISSRLKGAADAVGTLGSKAGHNVVETLGRMLKTAPQEVGGFLKNLASPNIRNTKNAVAALGDFGGSVINAMPNMGQSDPTAPGMPRNPEAKIEEKDFSGDMTKSLGLENEQPGDAFVRKFLPNVLPFGAGIAKSGIGHAGTELGKVAIKPFTDTYQQIKSLKQFPAANKEAGTAMDAYQNALAEEKAVKDQSYLSGTGRTEPVAHKKMLDAQTRLNELYDELRSTPASTRSDKEHADITDRIKTAQEEYDQAKAQSKSETNLADPNRIQYHINESRKKIANLEAEKAKGAPVTDAEMINAKNELESAENAHDEAKNIAESQVGTSKVNALQLKIGNHHNKLREIDEKLSANPELENVDVEGAKANLDTAQQHHNQAETMAEDANAAIGHHLNENADHALRGSRNMRHDIKSINDYWSSEYGRMMEDLKGEPAPSNAIDQGGETRGTASRGRFQLLNADRLDRINTAVDKAKKEFGADPTGEFADVLKRAPGYKETSASDFMAHQKSFRDARYELGQRARSEPDALRRRELFRAYEALRPFEDLINETLREGLGQHLPRYDYLQEGYRNQVYPLRENAVADKIMQGKPLSANMAQEFSGDQEGQGLLREIANRNPETRRNIVGQAYKKNPESIRNPDETLREYTNQMPDLHALQHQKETAESAQGLAKENLSQAKSAHDAALKQQAENEKIKATHAEQQQKLMTDKAKIQDKVNLLEKFKQNVAATSAKKEEAASTFDTLAKQKKKDDDLNKSIEQIKTRLATLEKHDANLRKTSGRLESMPTETARQALKRTKIRQDAMREIDEMHENIKTAQKNREALQQAANRKDITKSEMQRTQERLTKINKDIDRLVGKIGTASSVVLGIYATKSFSSKTGPYTNKND
jgi:hypothetical protein